MLFEVNDDQKEKVMGKRVKTMKTGRYRFHLHLELMWDLGCTAEEKKSM